MLRSNAFARAGVGPSTWQKGNQMSIEQTGQFTAHDAEGNQYVICVFTPFKEVRSSKGLHRIAGIPELTCNGLHVNRIDKGRYELLSRPQTTELFSDDPDAF